MEAEKNYLVIGYHRGKVIAKDEWNSLYYVECEEEMAPIGTLIEPRVLQPVQKLEKEEQKEIHEIYEKQRELIGKEHRQTLSVFPKKLTIAEFWRKREDGTGSDKHEDMGNTGREGSEKL